MTHIPKNPHYEAVFRDKMGIFRDISAIPTMKPLEQ